MQQSVATLFDHAAQALALVTDNQRAGLGKVDGGEGGLALGIEAVEGDFTPYDVYNAEEAFLSGTSGTIAPVSSLNAVGIGEELPGPVTVKLIEAWNDMVGLDFVAQALRHLGDNERGPALAEWKRRLAGRVDA